MAHQTRTGRSKYSFRASTMKKSKKVRAKKTLPKKPNTQRMMSSLLPMPHVFDYESARKALPDFMQDSGMDLSLLKDSDFEYISKSESFLYQEA